jgi:hypothetical protein
MAKIVEGFAVEVVEFKQTNYGTTDSQHVGLQLFAVEAEAIAYADACTASGDDAETRATVRRARADDRQWA